MGLVKARLIVKGNVQGVGYRVLVKLFARRLRVSGLVRNLDDGSVEVFVDGSGQGIRSLLEAMEVKGRPEDPLSLHVDGVDVYWEGEPGYTEAWRGYSGFELDYGVEGLSPAEEETLESLEWSKLHFTGMSRAFREELGGVRVELRETRGDVQEMHKDLKEETTGIRGAISGMHEDLKEGMMGVHSEVRDMHLDMSKSFEEMAKRYDAISSELVRTREELTRAVDTLVEVVRELLKRG